MDAALVGESLVTAPDAGRPARRASWRPAAAPPISDRHRHDPRQDLRHQDVRAGGRRPRSRRRLPRLHLLPAEPPLRRSRATVGEIVAACRGRFGGPDRWSAVGVFVDVPLDEARAICAEARLDLAQLCGAEDRRLRRARSALPVVRVVHVDGTGTPSASTVAADTAPSASCWTPRPMAGTAAPASPTPGPPSASARPRRSWPAA